MDTENTSSAGDSQPYAGQTEVTAFYDSQVDAEKAIEALRAAGFRGEDVSLIPRSEDEDAGAVVAVSQVDRLADAAAIMQQQGGQIGRPGKMGITQQGAGGDTLGGGMFTSGSSAGGYGAGTASGGAIF